MNDMLEEAIEKSRQLGNIEQGVQRELLGVLRVVIEIEEACRGHGQGGAKVMTKPNTLDSALGEEPGGES